MQYFIEEKDNIVLIKIDGDVIGGPDAITIKNSIQDCVNQGKNKVALDLFGVSLMNSSGLGILISALTTLRQARGDLVLVHVSEKIIQLLKITKLNTIIKIFDTVEKAADHLNK